MRDTLPEILPVDEHRNYNTGVNSDHIRANFIEANAEDYTDFRNAQTPPQERVTNHTNTLIRAGGNFEQLHINIDQDGQGTIELSMRDGCNNLPLKDKIMDWLFRRAGTGRIVLHVGEVGSSESGVISPHLLDQIEDIFNDQDIPDDEMLAQILSLSAPFGYTKHMEVENIQFNGDTLNFSGLDIEHATFEKVRFSNMSLDYALATHANFQNVIFDTCQTAHFDISHSTIGICCAFRNTDLRAANAANATIDASALRSLEITNCDLRRADFSNNTILQRLLLDGSDRQIIHALRGTCYNTETTIFHNDPTIQARILARLERVSSPIELGSDRLGGTRVIYDIKNTIAINTLTVSEYRPAGNYESLIIPLEDGAFEIFAAPNTDDYFKRTIDNNGGAQQSFQEIIDHWHFHERRAWDPDYMGARVFRSAFLRNSRIAN